MKKVNPEYLEKARQLSEEEQERLLSRMGGKLPRKLEKEKLTLLEAMAIQLELEDEQLQEWRARMHEIKAKELAAANAAPKSKKASSTTSIEPETKKANKSAKSVKSVDPSKKTDIKTDIKSATKKGD